MRPRPRKRDPRFSEVPSAWQPPTRRAASGSRGAPTATSPAMPRSPVTDAPVPGRRQPRRGDRDAPDDRRCACRFRPRGRRRPGAADPTPTAAPAAPAPARKPNKFMADLGKAMQAAAESARTDTLERFSAEAKTHIESIHADSANEATDLRKQADDDSLPSVTGRRRRSPASAKRPTSASPIARPSSSRDRGARRPDRDAHRAGPGPRRPFEAEMADVLRAPARRARPDPLRGHGREPARAAAFDREAWSDAARRASAPPPARRSPSRPRPPPRPPPSRPSRPSPSHAAGRRGRGRAAGRRGDRR